MQYNQNLYNKILKFLKNPAVNRSKIIPYAKDQLIFPIKKKVYEFFRNDKLSKPYPGHDKLMHYIKNRNSFFVVGGGNDGYFQDPTYYLEKFCGWKGIIIEPLPVYKTCVKNRKASQVFNYALVSSDYKDESIVLVDCNAMSIVKGLVGWQDWVKAGEEVQSIKAEELVVPARTLQNVVEEYFKENGVRRIELLVLDVEGYELEALKGFDINLYCPKFLLLEIQSQEKKLLIEDYIGPQYKLLEKIAYHDYLYKLNE